mmetsp:Transcript_10839/g.27962  ORF Transcript_10839/g.27962 Transcript_10839/m.27962 type:complete len:93 (+) Transcript_10839:1099-1377(+)
MKDRVDTRMVASIKRDTYLPILLADGSSATRKIDLLKLVHRGRNPTSSGELMSEIVEERDLLRGEFDFSAFKGRLLVDVDERRRKLEPSFSF